MQYLWARRLPPTHNQPAGPHPRLSLAGLPRPATHLQVEICHTLHKKLVICPIKTCNMPNCRIYHMPYLLCMMWFTIQNARCNMRYTLYAMPYYHQNTCHGISNTECVLWGYQIYTYIYIYIYVLWRVSPRRDSQLVRTRLEYKV
jgi:hypothetical protein